MVERYASHLTLLAVTLWVGALWAIGFIAVPTLFAMSPDRMLAGEIAGRLFQLVAWIGFGAGGWILLHALVTLGKGALRNRTFGVVVLMLVTAAAIQFQVQPDMARMKAEARPLDVMASPLAGDFQRAHRISTGLYVLQCVLGIVLVLGVQHVAGECSGGHCAGGLRSAGLPARRSDSGSA